MRLCAARSGYLSNTDEEVEECIRDQGVQGACWSFVGAS